MMKINVWGASAIAAAVLAIAALASPSQAEAREISYANHLPPDHPINQAMRTYFNSVTKASHGDLKFKLYPGGALGGGKALISVVRNDVADSGFVNPVYDPSTLRVEATLSELLYPDPLVLDGAMNEMVMLHCPQCRAELSKINVVPLTSYSVPSFQLICNKPMKTPEDARGTKVRAVGALALIATKMNMIPVDLTSDETFEGMQRGQVSCVMAPFDWLKTNNLSEVSTDIVTTPLGSIGGLLHFAMNKSVWNSLSNKERSEILGGLGKQLAHAQFIYDKGSDDALAKAKASGKHVYPLTGKLAEDLKQFQHDQVDRIIAKATKAGISNPKGLFDTYLGLLTKWKKIIKEEGRTEAGFAKALNREIFSKIKPTAD